MGLVAGALSGDLAEIDGGVSMFWANWVLAWIAGFVTGWAVFGGKK